VQTPAARTRHVATENQQRRQDDDVLNHILFGRTPTKSPFFNKPKFANDSDRDDAALAGILGEAAGNTDDLVLAKLLSGEEEKLHTPMLALVADVVRCAREVQLCFTAEVAAGGHGRGDGPFQLSRPLGIAVDGAGAILVADNGNGRLMRWARDSVQGQAITERGRSFRDPFGVAFDRNGAVIASSEGAVWLLGAAGGGSSGAVGQTALARGSWPTGLAMEGNGAVVYADTLDHSVVRCVISQGTLRREIVAGGHGIGGGLHQLHRPCGVAPAEDGVTDGAVVVVDSGNHRIVRWARGAKKAEVVAGGRSRGSRLDQLNYPRGVIVDWSGCLIIADTLNHRVLRWAPGARKGEVVAGGRGQGGRLDQLNKPVGLALDGASSLLIADSGNHRVLRLPLRPRGVRHRGGR